MRGARGLRELLARPGIVVAPGAYDAVSARLVERAGFEAVYVGSYATAAARLGLPDAGLVSLREMADHAAAVVGAVEGVPVVADAENGFGSATTVWRTVREFERAGVAGVHLEDHEFGKHLPVRGRVLAKAAMAEKIRAAVEARRDPDFVIIARTDAGWLEGGGGLEEIGDRGLPVGAGNANQGEFGRWISIKPSGNLCQRHSRIRDQNNCSILYILLFLLNHNRPGTFINSLLNKVMTVKLGSLYRYK